jgi:tetratricopeptide (TPR) repeat protein
LGFAYYRFARAALDRKEFPAYESHLGKAMAEWLESLRIEPENPAPHTFMGMAAAYQGRIDDAVDSFYNARQLEPRAGTAYTNIAETLIYAGRSTREVEVWLQRGERMGVSAGVVELNYCLLRWRDGEAESAARHFYRALKFDPELVRVWNEAPVSTPIKTFDDLTQYCCGSPACGPYLETACTNSERKVARRELPEETTLRELRIEMERRREIDRIYKERQDLEIKPRNDGASQGREVQSRGARDDDAYAIRRGGRSRRRGSVRWRA